MSPAAMAYWMKVSNFLTSFLSIHRVGSKPRTSPAILVVNCAGSNFVIGPMPERPAMRPSHAELFFERHDELDSVERIGSQIFHERCFGRDLVGVDSELFDDDCFDPLLNGHRFLLHLISGNPGCLAGFSINMK